MISTFTPNTPITENTVKTEQISKLPEFANPSVNTINTILNYSKNLEIKPSEFIKDIEIIKS